MGVLAGGEGVERCFPSLLCALNPLPLEGTRNCPALPQSLGGGPNTDRGAEEPRCLCLPLERGRGAILEGRRVTALDEPHAWPNLRTTSLQEPLPAFLSSQPLFHPEPSTHHNAGLPFRWEGGVQSACSGRKRVVYY